ncbi:hypothetical protein IT396_03725 [Candidatus Nomurabacteria bacterium]|nr:hypothetical protein [Candidatus Nomurabacteria bacterium]
MNTTTYTVGVTSVVLVVAVAVWGLSGVSAPLPVNPDPFNNPETSSPTTTTIKLALLDTAALGNGKERGCDRVVMIDRKIAATSSVLNASMRELFAEDREELSGAFNFIARTNETLMFERATIEAGTAHIYLMGSLSGLAGVCDDPRAQIQIEETALQFSSIERVEIYLNGTKTNLTPSQQ